MNRLRRGVCIAGSTLSSKAEGKVAKRNRMRLITELQNNAPCNWEEENGAGHNRTIAYHWLIHIHCLACFKRQREDTAMRITHTRTTA